MVGKGNYVGGRPKDESKLSQKPSQIRNRLRRAAKGTQKKDGRIVRDMEMLYKKPLDAWDIQELSHGRPRNKVGNFSGRTPSWVTPQVQQEARRRLLTHTLGELTGHVDLAVGVVVKLILSTELDDKGKPIVDARTKLDACKFIIEHVTGKPQAMFKIEASDDTKKALAAAIIMDDGKPQGHLAIGPVIQGEFVENEEEESNGE